MTTVLDRNGCIQELEELLNSCPRIQQPTLIQLSVNLPPLHLLGWLKGQTLYPKIYWQNREQTSEAACIGRVVEQLWQVPTPEQYQQRIELGAHPSPWRYYGGFGFDPLDAKVCAMGGNRLRLPRWEVRRQHGQCILLMYIALSPEQQHEQRHAALQHLHSLKSEQSLLTPQIHISQSQHTPEFQGWKSNIQQAHQSIELCHPPQSEPLQKVVLARDTRIQLTHSINCWDWLALWQQQQPTTYQFAIEHQPGEAFLGCSPERLFWREKQQLHTEALAGTCSRTWHPQQDAQQAQTLLHDPKNRLENQLVVDDIQQQLKPICERVWIEAEPQIRQLSTVQHLCRELRAQLKANISDQQLIQTLHPTAAINGLPRQTALEFIQTHEPMQRGWYAGTFGFSGDDCSEFCVTIRSAKQSQQMLHIFAGAGIVKDSVASSEWQELNNKLAGAMNLLYTL